MFPRYSSFFVACFAACVATILASTAHANTWLVDGTPGPGVQFSQIAAAVQAAQPGDIILVNGGSYAPFIVDKGLVIIGYSTVGTGWVSVSGEMRVANLPAGELVVVSGILPQDLVVDGCAGAVVVYGGQYFGVQITQSSDVRLHRLHMFAPLFSTAPALSVSNSRVECRDSFVSGGIGTSESVNSPNLVVSDGGPGMVVGAGSRVVLVGSFLNGGVGGSALQPTHFGGNGGLAVDVAPAAELIAPIGSYFDGGDGGRGPLYPTGCAQNGAGGSGIRTMGGLVRLSTRQVSGGINGPYLGCTPPIMAPAVLGNGFQVPTHRDPILVWTGSFASVGDVIPGETVTLKISKHLIMSPTPGVLIEDMVPADRVLTQTATANYALFPVQVPAGLPPGSFFAMQAELRSGTQVRRTNSAWVLQQ